MVETAPRKAHTFMFKAAIITATVVTMGLILCLLPAGRYGVARLRLALASSTSAPRDLADTASMKGVRDAAVSAAKSAVVAQWANANPSQRDFFQIAGLSPDQAVCRWGNGNSGFILSGKVFEADDLRSYRLKPGTHSVWLKQMPASGPNQFFLVPDDPRVRQLAMSLGAQVIRDSEQATNSWGCRGLEPELSAEIRVLVIGDSFMQGMFISDLSTGPVQLERRLHELSKRTVSVLNTGHLGYSPEQYYFTALEFASRFHPHLVLISVCSNDTTLVSDSGQDLLAAEEWLAKIRHHCVYELTPPTTCLLVLAPLHKNLEVTRNASHYPSSFMNMIKFGGARTLDPTEAFINEDLRLRGPLQEGPIPLFNLHLMDGHFSPQGCAVWAEEAARRILLLLGIR